MNRAEKAENVESLAGDFRKATVAVLAEYRGLTSGQLNHLRRTIREANGRCRVAKNRLAKLAIADTHCAPLGDHLKGPTALLIGFKDPVALAKVAVKLAGEMPKLEIKAAVLDGQVMPASAVKALADLPPREVLLAQLLGLLQAPASQLLRTLNEPAARLARLVDALGKRADGGAA
jgi:large subunit ribosomal protein L10